MTNLSNLLGQTYSGYTGSRGFTGSQGVQGDTGFVGSAGTAGATGGGTDRVFYQNDQNITTNYTVPSTQNAVTTGPIIINNGITVTVDSGGRWVIV